MSLIESESELRIPVTLLTGFLGAGKTTLLNSILSTSDGTKIAVIVNEFGEAGLDHDLIDVVDEEVVLMQSGCLCCSIRGDLSRTLQDLIARKQEGTVTFDRVVIETTGLADPVPILQTFFVDRFLARTFRMDGVVTIADSTNGAKTLDQQFEAVSQVAMADLLVLSKADLSTENQLFEFKARLRSLNPNANILQADFGKVPVASLWNLSGMRIRGEEKQVMAWLSKNEDPQNADPLKNLSGLAPTAPAKTNLNAHDDRIGTASIVLNEPICADAFDHWLNTLIMLRGSDILRVKGIVHLDDIELPFVFHGVQHIFDPPVPLIKWSGNERQSRIVVIARDMTNAEITRSLDMLRYKKRTVTHSHST